MIPALFHIIVPRDRRGARRSIPALDGIRRSHPRWDVRVWKFGDTEGFFLSDEIADASPRAAADATAYEVLCRYGGVCLHPDLVLVRPVDALLRNTDAVLLGDGLGRVSTHWIASSPSHPLFWAAVRELPGMRRQYLSDAYGAGEQMLSQLMHARFPETLVVPEGAVIGRLLSQPDGGWTLPASACGAMVPVESGKPDGFVHWTPCVEHTTTSAPSSRAVASTG